MLSLLERGGRRTAFQKTYSTPLLRFPWGSHGPGPMKPQSQPHAGTEPPRRQAVTDALQDDVPLPPWESPFESEEPVAGENDSKREPTNGWAVGSHPEKAQGKLKMCLITGPNSNTQWLLSWVASVLFMPWLFRFQMPVSDLHASIDRATHYLETLVDDTFWVVTFCDAKIISFGVT